MMVCQQTWVCIQLCTGGVLNKLCWGGLPIVLPNPTQHQNVPATRQAATQTCNVWQDQRPPHIRKFIRAQITRLLLTQRQNNYRIQRVTYFFNPVRSVGVTILTECLNWESIFICRYKQTFNFNDNILAPKLT